MEANVLCIGINLYDSVSVLYYMYPVQLIASCKLNVLMGFMINVAGFYLSFQKIHVGSRWVSLARFWIPIHLMWLLELDCGI